MMGISSGFSRMVRHQFVVGGLILAQALDPNGDGRYSDSVYSCTARIALCGKDLWN